MNWQKTRAVRPHQSRNTFASRSFAASHVTASLARMLSRTRPWSPLLARPMLRRWAALWPENRPTTVSQQLAAHKQGRAFDGRIGLLGSFGHRRFGGAAGCFLRAASVLCLFSGGCFVVPSLNRTGQRHRESAQEKFLHGSEPTENPREIEAQISTLSPR